MNLPIVKSAALLALLALPGLAGTTPAPAAKAGTAIPKPTFGPMPQPLPLSEQVDVNHATKAALMKLPGVTSALADKIIANRPYLSKAKLVTKGVVPFPVFQGFRDHVYTGVVTTAKP